MRNFRILPSFLKLSLWKKTGPSKSKESDGINRSRKTSLISAGLFLLLSFSVAAQQTAREKQERCGTMQRLQLMMDKSPALKARFENERALFNRAV
ncbi:MAG TPA: hypothetical protein VNS32_09005, partial [Flavisolibacter sp.]|nr:hypothetical protein [Flavisolibacter sp.]